MEIVVVPPPKTDNSLSVVPVGATDLPKSFNVIMYLPQKKQMAVGIGVVFAICLIVLIVLVRRNPVCAVFFVHASVCAHASMVRA